MRNYYYKDPDKIYNSYYKEFIHYISKSLNFLIYKNRKFLFYNKHIYMYKCILLKFYHDNVL